ncbi:MAG: type II toxin-antitoxin system CcdA family antitoxin [Kofleriaceae bacterium]
MRPPSYDPTAPKQTVNLTINRDLYARAKRLSINASQIAERALATEVTRLEAEQIKADIQADLAAIDAYEQKHGSFVQMMREHYGEGADETAIRGVSESKPASATRVSTRRRAPGRHR